MSAISFVVTVHFNHLERKFSMNQIVVIKPYRYAGTWVFDDPRVELVAEPFVCGVPEIIDAMVADIPDAEKGFRMLFSKAPFPGAIQFNHVRDEDGGATYHDPAGNEGWLCPALLLYFANPPKHIYAKAEPLN